MKIRKNSNGPGKFPGLFLLIGLVSALAFPLKAQKFEGGMRIGMTATQVAGDQLVGFNQAGLLAGFFVSRELSERVSLSMEMMFIQKGSRKPTDKTDNSYYIMRLNYIEVPLLVQIRAGKKFRFETGPGFGVLVGSKEEDQIGEINYAPEFNSTEWSFNAGLNYLLNDKWSVDARYSFSLIPIRPFEDAYNYRYLDRGQYNAVVQLSLNYRF